MVRDIPKHIINTLFEIKYNMVYRLNFGLKSFTTRKNQVSTQRCFDVHLTSKKFKKTLILVQDFRDRLQQILLV